MKRIIPMIFIYLLCVPVFSQINKTKADSIVANYLKNNNLHINTQLYSAPNLFADSIIYLELYNDSVLAPNNNCYVYFLDEKPEANWCHNSRFLFVTSTIGVLSEIHTTSPPKDFMKWEICSDNRTIEDASYQPLFGLKNNQRHTKNSSNHINDHCFAIILSGGATVSMNPSRYWNDCAAMYTILTDIYGYKDENIIVIMSDGTNTKKDQLIGEHLACDSPTDLDNDGDTDVLYSAHKANISIVFDSLSKKITDQDFLFVFTTDHGGDKNGHFLNLWSGERFYTDEFAAELDKINAKCISIVMGQCFSGGFIAPLSRNNRILTTACDMDEPSFARDKYTYEEFLYHWMNAMAGFTVDTGISVNADFDNNGFTSMEEAFLYAQTNDEKDETPQFHTVRNNYGKYVSLAGEMLVPDLLISDTTYQTNVVEYGQTIRLNNVTVCDSACLKIEAQNRTILDNSIFIKKGSSLVVNKPR